MLNCLWGGKLWKIVCPDKSVRLVYYDPRQAFMAVFYDSEKKNSAKLKFQNVQAELGAEEKNKINQAASIIDAQSASIEVSYRIQYNSYAAAPCDNIEHLNTATERLLEEHRLLHRVTLQINALLLSFSERALTKEHFVEQLSRSLEELRIAPSSGIASKRLSEAAKIARELSEPE